MPTSEARILANQKNASLSTGPKTEAGKERSRQNGLKHGLAGSGAVAATVNADQVDRLAMALSADLRPKSPLGAALIAKLARCSVRSERAGHQEDFALAERVRHAVDDFDQAKADEADLLFEQLAESPRRILRQLKRTPHGVDRLLEAWAQLADDLSRNVPSAWAAAQLDLITVLTGRSIEDAWGSRLGALSRATGGDFLGLSQGEGDNLDDDSRRVWARARLAERIEAEIAALKAHRETLNLDAFEIDRVEAPARALFDPSKEAILARRYGSEADRGFYKALKEFRQAEAEFLERAEALAAEAAEYEAAELASLRDQITFNEPWATTGPPDRPPGGGPSLNRTDGVPQTSGRAVQPAS
jgi:hypothetical protein